MLPLLTFRGFLILGAILLGPLFALLLNWELVSAVLFSSAVILLLAALLVLEFLSIGELASLISIQAKLPARIYSGNDALLSLNIELPAAHSRCRITFRPESPAGIQLESETKTLQIEKNISRCTLKFQFRPLKRGPLRWSSVSLRIRRPHGLFSWQLIKPLEGQVEADVYPDPYAHGQTTRQPFQLLAAGYSPFEQRAGEGKEFDRLRSYAVGDDMRHVDWKRTAKRGNLLVKVYRPETHQRINLVLDCSRRMGTIVDQRLQLDFAADAAAHLSQLATDNDDEVGLLAFNHQVIAKLPCRRGRVQRHLILDTLKQLNVGALEADYRLMTGWGRTNRRRSLFVVLTSVASAIGLEQLRESLQPLSARHLPLVVAIYDRDLETLGAKPVSSLEDAYIHGAAFSQRVSIQQRIAQLRHTGIECIYADVRNLPQALRAKYYQLKISGKL